MVLHIIWPAEAVLMMLRSTVAIASDANHDSHTSHANLSSTYGLFNTTVAAVKRCGIVMGSPPLTAPCHEMGSLCMLLWTSTVAVLLGGVIWISAMMARKHRNIDGGRSIRDDGKPSLWSAWNVHPETEAETNDPGLMQKHTTFQSYTTSRAVYPSVRTFYRPHSQADKLPSEPAPLPLLVFIHGLGGCLSSFTPILTSLINVAPCFGIDLPGCGRSQFAPTSWEAYTQEALAELVAVAIRQHCSKLDQDVILVAHSMGCSLSATLATSYLAPKNEKGVVARSIIGICPRASALSSQEISQVRTVIRIPTPIFDIIRTFDRRNGLDSASIARFTGKDASLELKRMQMTFNRQSRTPVFRRILYGMLARRSSHAEVATGLASLKTWATLEIPVFLCAGEADTVTKPEETVIIGQALGRAVNSERKSNEDISKPFLEEPDCVPTTQEAQRHPISSNINTTEDTTSTPLSTTPVYSHRKMVLKTTILPSPASHALLYDPATYRTLAGLIQTFLADHVDPRLSLGWQLQYLSTEGKWDVKNLVKWQAIEPVSEPIAGIFRAMKTLREIDTVHSPSEFVQRWTGKISAVIDISYESPVYDPKGLEEGGIEYHKMPTVSKIPPTADEAREFVRIVDYIRNHPNPNLRPNIKIPPAGPQSESVVDAYANLTPHNEHYQQPLIGVHCHYGFNRTGFFICCYLIEREGYSVQQAIEEFARSRPEGIKHAHFLDQLFVRYCVGIKRSPTL